MILFLELAFIFFSRVVDVSMGTMRMLLIVKGRRLQAATIGFFEVIIYIVALGRVVNSLDNPINLLVYALGFAAGNFAGIYFEEKLALGHIAVQVIPSEHDYDLIDNLREEGYGVTVTEGSGRDGLKHILTVYAPRKELSKILKLVDQIDSKAFTAVMDAKKTLGGYYRQHKGK